MPKSGYSANSEAKVCAMNLVARMNGKETIEFSGINTCYRFIIAKEAVNVTGEYRVDKGAIVAAAGTVGVSPDLPEPMPPTPKAGSRIFSLRCQPDLPLRRENASPRRGIFFEQEFGSCRKGSIRQDGAGHDY
jgi:Flavocytochrome c sulphide dehydrogenase, flavin-binding